MSTTDRTVADTIALQLGGFGRLAAMTGATGFVYDATSLRFKLGKGAKNGITHVVITLDPSDTYTVEFTRVWNRKVTPKAKVEDVYCDMLMDVFEAETGFFLTFNPRA